MKFALQMPRCQSMLAMLENSLFGLTVIFILTSLVAVAHSGLVMVE